MGRDRILLAVLAGGFLLLGVETRFEHRDVVRETATAWIPVVASIMGFAVALLAIFSRSVRHVSAAIAFAVVGLSGLVGMALHTELKPGPFAQLFGVAGSSTGEEVERFEDFEHGNEQEASPPALAPLSLGGLGFLGMLIVFPVGKPKGQVAAV